MANVGFKMGLQTDLDPKLLLGTNAGGVPGTFYLTSDTNRLYIGKADGSIAPVNAGIITVDKVKYETGDAAGLTYLPAVSDSITGHYYYAKQENILCIFNGSSWVQINAIVTNKTVANSLNTSNGVVSVSTTVTDSNNGSKTGSYTVTGANGITVSGTGTAMTITGDPITVATAEGTDNDATTTFKSASGATNGSVSVKGGDNVTVSATGSVITVAAKDTTNKSVSTENNADSGFNIIVTDSSNTQKSGKLDPKIKIGKNESTVSFIGGAADLDVYTISEVDGLFTNFGNELDKTLQGFNAMEYQGTVGSSTADWGATLPTSNVKSGYSYLVTGDNFTGADGKAYPAGTLIVAHGSEDGSGYLSPIEWSYVTGSTADTQYEGSAVSGGMTLVQKTNNATVLSLTAQAADVGTTGIGSDIVIGSSATSGKSQVLSVAHKKYSNTVSGTDATDQPDDMLALSTYDIPVISGITVSNGHVTGYTVKTYTVKDTNATLSISTNVSASGNTATVAQAFTTKNGLNAESTKNSNFTVASSSLEVTANTGSTGMNINLVWGSF